MRLRLNRQQWVLIAFVLVEFVLPRFQVPRPHPPAPFREFAVFALILVGITWFLRPPAPSPRAVLPRWLGIPVFAFFVTLIGYAAVYGMTTGTLPIFPPWLDVTYKAVFGVALVAAFVQSGTLSAEEARREHRITWRSSAAVVIGLMGAGLALRAVRAFAVCGPQCFVSWFDAAAALAVLGLAFRVRPREVSARAPGTAQ